MLALLPPRLRLCISMLSACLCLLMLGAGSAHAASGGQGYIPFAGAANAGDQSLDPTQGATGQQPLPVEQDPQPVIKQPRPKEGNTGGGLFSGIPYSDLILQYAAIRSLDPALVAAVIKQESGFNPR